MSAFVPEPAEKVFHEEKATYIKKFYNVKEGYIFITSKRFVFCSQASELSKVISKSKSHCDIIFSIPLETIVSTVEAKHLFTKKAVITTNDGKQHSILFSLHEKCLSLLQNCKKIINTGKKASDFDNGCNSKPAWYYEEAGQKSAAMTLAEMKQLVSNNHTVYRFTKVWSDGMDEWKKAEDTELAEYFEGPPPLSGDSVSNVLVWFLAFAPVIGVNIEGFIATLFNLNNLWFITIVLNLCLSLLDERKLNMAGHNTRALGFGSAWLVPIYLFKRAKILNHSMGYFWTWIITFGLTLLAAF